MFWFKKDKNDKIVIDKKQLLLQIEQLWPTITKIELKSLINNLK